MNIERPFTYEKPQTSWLALTLRFRRKDEGSVTIFSIFLILMMLGVMGIAVDFMRAERNRTVLQHTLDRAVLAAADLDQQRPAADVVQDYFKAAGLESTLSDVVVDEGLNYKALYASAEVNTHAPWLDMLTRWDINRTADSNSVQVDETGRKIASAECSGDVTATETPKLDEYGNPVLDGDGNVIMTHPSEVTLNHCVGTAETQSGSAATKSKSMLASAEAAAEERVQNVEISMVLDVSGSMGWNNKMPRLKDAANTFIDTVINPSTDGLVSVSLVPYDEGVSLGTSFYNTLRNRINVTHRHNYSHCLEFEDSEFDEVGLRFNQTYDQMQHTRLYSSWGFQCSTDSRDDITVMSQDSTALKAKVDSLQPSGNTHIFLGMKWAAALLAPNFNPILGDMVSANMVDNAFATRPAAFDDVETLKTIVLMTDGTNTSSYRVQDWAYQTPSHYVHWNNWGIMNYLQRYVRHNHYSQYYYTKYNSTTGDALLSNICDAAKADGIVIWSIGFEVDDHGADVMQSCASSPSHFFRVEGIEISDAFAAIARQINQLRLTQ